MTCALTLALQLEIFNHCNITLFNDKGPKWLTKSKTQTDQKVALGVCVFCWVVIPQHYTRVKCHNNIGKYVQNAS